MQPEKEVGLVAHNYQPPREIWLHSQKKALLVEPKYNGIIYDQCYRHILEESIPQKGFIFSFYGTLREWIKREKPEGYLTIKKNISFLTDKGNVLGDPYLHDILPLLPDEDQRMLVKIGREAFCEDLGFYPVGFWFPETAVNRRSLEIVKNENYEYVVLGDHQLSDASDNPMRINLSGGKEITVVHFDSHLSGKYSYDDSITQNGDTFLDRDCFGEGVRLVASDGEFYNHHKEGRHYFRDYVLNEETLRRHGVKAFEVTNALNYQKKEALLTENSSWSCPHNLRRWTGEERCFCDNPNAEVRAKKRKLYWGLREKNEKINNLLDEEGRNWREKFCNSFLLSRNIIFSGEEFPSDFLDNLKSPSASRRLYLAKLYALIGFTSCGWFFGSEDSIERKIPKECLNEISCLLLDY